MKKIIRIITFLIILIILFTIKSEAATFGLSANKSSVTVGESFNVTISGIYGKVSISGNNVGLSTSGTQWVEGSLSITATTKSVGKATISVTAIDAATTGANPEEITGSKSVSVEVKEKVVETPATQTTPNKTPSTTTNKTNNKTTTTNKTTNKKETNKTVTPTQEKEEASSEWGIHNLKLIGVKEDETKVELTINPVFSIKQYEYNCEVPKDIVKIEFEKEAYEYTELIKITGDELLKEGENIYTLELEKDEKEKLIYTITVNKEKAEVVEETKPVQVEPIKEEYYIKMKPMWFALLEIVVIFFSVISTIIIQKIIAKHSSKH